MEFTAPTIENSFDPVAYGLIRWSNSSKALSGEAIGCKLPTKNVFKIVIKIINTSKQFFFKIRTQRSRTNKHLMNAGHDM